MSIVVVWPCAKHLPWLIDTVLRKILWGRYCYNHHGTYEEMEVKCLVKIHTDDLKWGEAVPDSLAPVPTLLTSTVNGKNEAIEEPGSQHGVISSLMFKRKRLKTQNHTRRHTRKESSEYIKDTCITKHNKYEKSKWSSGVVASVFYPRSQRQRQMDGSLWVWVQPGLYGEF